MIGTIAICRIIINDYFKREREREREKVAPGRGGKEDRIAVVRGGGGMEFISFVDH